MKALLLIATVFLAGCGPSGGATPFHVGAQPTTAPDPSVAAIAFMAPLFMPAGDRPALAAGLAKYQAECEAALGWSQPPGSLAIFETVAAPFHGTAATPPRWYVLRWPPGPTGRPRRLEFAPEWGSMLVQDRRYILGIPASRPLDANEVDAIMRSRMLPAYLAPVGDPSIYDN